MFARYSHDVPFALIYLLDRDCHTARLAAASGFEPRPPESPSIIDLTDGSDATEWPVAAAVRTKTVQVVDDLESRFLSRAPWPDPPRQALVLPIESNLAHQPAGVLVVGVSPRLEFDAAHRGFIDLAAPQLGTALANARAPEEERRRAEALAEIDRAKTVFFSNVSHAFRTPLTLMLGPLEESLRDAGDPLSPGQRQRQETIQRCAVRLLKLVNSLLDFSRIEAGRIQASDEPTDIARSRATTKTGSARGGQSNVNVRPARSTSGRNALGESRPQSRLEPDQTRSLRRQRDTACGGRRRHVPGDPAGIQRGHSTPMKEHR